MYDAPLTEKKWVEYWKEHKAFAFSGKGKNIYVIDTPPPFTSGEMHMGTVLGFTLSDIVARYKRARGMDVLLPLGFDAHGFPTERAVEKKFGKGLSREEFYKKCIETSTGNMTRMKEQIERLGFSFNSLEPYVTISDDYMAKIQLSLIMMHEKGLVYRGEHPVLWCPYCASSVANAEVNDREEETYINHVIFKVPGSKSGNITIATTRPELMHACVAIAVNPTDKKHKELVGKEALSPVFSRPVKIIADAAVDSEFGTGAEMVCTFGDKADVEMFHRDKLQLIEAMDQRGKLKNAGKYDGMSLSDARNAILEDLKAEKALVKQEVLKHSVKVHDRCDTRLEYLKSTQWFIKIRDHLDKIKQLADEVKWYPDFAKQRIYDWAEYIDWDWTISRNRVFGTPLPFWYCSKCGEIIAASKEKLPVDPVKAKAPADKCPKCKGNLTGEAATCDVWIDSSISPLIITGWPNKDGIWEKNVPVALRQQGTEIIRTWAFYTLFRTWALTGKKSWEAALINGMVLGSDGKIMHKSSGNGVSPDELLAKGYPVDAIRLWAALSGAIGKDRQLEYKDVDYAKGFIIKMFNSAMFVKGALDGAKMGKEPHDSFNIFDVWILNRLNTITKQVTEAYDHMNFYEVASTLMDFYWHEFCDYYIEDVKHRIYSKEKSMAKSRHAAQFTLQHVLDGFLRLIAPIAPFTAEEINSMFHAGTITKEPLPGYVEKPQPSAYAINGLVFESSIIEMDYEDAGAFINKIIGEARKEKAKAKIALNKEIASINIKVPEEYNSAVLAAKEEIKHICKAKEVAVSVSKEFSVLIQV